MKRYTILTLLFLAISFTNCTSQNKDTENRTKIQLETNKGTILLALYNETPKHRNNFIKLTKQHFFDGTLFHRVIDNFMIQGGDPDSKNANPGVALGNGGPGYEILAEIRVNEGIIHKKGALAAARNGDDINPKRNSAGSQFYLVKGKVFTEEQLKNMEKSKNAKLRRKLITSFKKEYKSEIDSLVQLQKNTKDTISLQQFVANLNLKIDSIVAEKGFHFTEKQLTTYTTIGGVPHLDGGYTVFGEIIEGQDIVDEISELKTDERDRPLEDVIIKKVKILE